MRGPHWVVSSVPGPTCTAAIRATRPSTKASWTAPCDEEPVRGGARLAAVAHLGDHGALEGRVDVGVGEHDEGGVAAELHGALEDRSAAVRSSRRPTSVEPVNDSIRVRRWASMASTTGPGSEVVTTLSTPAGRPASCSRAATASAVSGVSAAGLSTTVQPAARAGAILRVAMAAGKFHGVMSTLTPTGWWVTSNRLAPLGEWPT